MGFGEAIRTCFQKYASFRGRARRSEYWFFMLFCALAGIAAAILDLIIFFGGRLQPISGIVSLALVLPQMAVLTRRLHDTDHSGWWVLGLYSYLVVVAVSMNAETEGSGELFIVLLALGLVGYAVWVFVLTVMRGTGGTNTYGPDPFAQPADVF